jgi:hypothetical protein
VHGEPWPGGIILSTASLPAGVSLAVLLFAATVLVLLLVLTVAVLLIINRRRGSRLEASQDSGEESPPPVDAWEEAGQRVRPYEPPSE